VNVGKGTKEETKIIQRLAIMALRLHYQTFSFFFVISNSGAAKKLRRDE